jgi:hypothetical protein
MFCRVVLMAFLSMAWAAAGATPQNPKAQGSPALAGRVLELPVHARALEGNRLGDTTERSVTVYLPPSYDHAPRRRYPVIYSLGGYAAVPALASQPGYGPINLIVAPIDHAIASGHLGEVIVVDIQGRNRLGGSFWVNSSTTGRWEDFVTQDVIHAVESRFRTIPRRASRGLYGESMGGFGAISIAMHRPELFGTVFAQSPCCLALVEELGPTPAWPALEHLPLAQADAAFQHGDPRPLSGLALAAAFAPDPRHPPLYADLPYRAEGEHVVPNGPVYAHWAALLPAARLDREAAGLKTLRGLRIQYGDHDDLRHILVSAPAFDRALTAHGVRHEFKVDHGGHVEFDRFGRDAVPFFARTLEGAGATAPPGPLAAGGG